MRRFQKQSVTKFPSADENIAQSLMPYDEYIEAGEAEELERLNEDDQGDSNLSSLMSASKQNNLPMMSWLEPCEYRRSLLEMKTAIIHIEESNHTGDSDKYVYSTNTSRGSRLFLPDTRARPAARPIF